MFFASNQRYQYYTICNLASRRLDLSPTIGPPAPLNLTPSLVSNAISYGIRTMSPSFSPCILLFYSIISNGPILTFKPSIVFDCGISDTSCSIMGHDHSKATCPISDTNGPGTFRVPLKKVHRLCSSLRSAIQAIIGSLKWHDISIIIAGATALFSVLIAVFLIFRHACHFSCPREQKQCVLTFCTLNSFLIGLAIPESSVSYPSSPLSRSSRFYVSGKMLLLHHILSLGAISVKLWQWPHSSCSCRHMSRQTSATKAHSSLKWPYSIRKELCREVEVLVGIR